MSIPYTPAVARALRKVVQGKARRGLFAGKHIKFGNNVSEDGGNKYVHLIVSSTLSNIAHPKSMNHSVRALTMCIVCL